MPAGDEEKGAPLNPSGNQLSAIIRRKQQQIENQLKELGMDALQERLEDAAETPAKPPYRLARLVQDIRLRTGRPVMVLEIVKPSPSSTSEDVGALAAQYAGWGADALAVLTDLDYTSTGYADMVAVCRATNVPVLQRDWILHPLQVVEAKEAGAAGVLGAIANVCGPRGAPVLSSYAAAIGLDCPVEGLQVVNKNEVEAMDAGGVPFYAINLAVGISLAIPGFQTDMAKRLLYALPQGASSIVGVKSIQEAVRAHAEGADVLLLRREMLEEAESQGQQGVERLLEQLRDATSGDD
ncbi:g2293 [Coccomyxa viridis]|uniref:indole-3-glycerol-phosphate synthase n=1 Tax=Coccomyxa viridis TaxID=1274662 RepID=A0ABP1FNY6_9CHLO